MRPVRFRLRRLLGAMLLLLGPALGGECSAGAGLHEHSGDPRGVGRRLGDDHLQLRRRRLLRTVEFLPAADHKPGEMIEIGPREQGRKSARRERFHRSRTPTRSSAG